MVFDSALGARQTEAPTEPDPRRVAQQLWQTIFAKCGDSYYFRFDDGDLMQLKDVSFDIVPESLSRADQANGVWWRGYALAGSVLEKHWSRPQAHNSDVASKGWDKWADGYNIGLIKREMRPFVGRCLLRPRLRPQARVFCVKWSARVRP